MANMLTCDSCGKEITDLNAKAQVIGPTADGRAGGMIDLCSTCAKGVLADSKVKKAMDTFKRRADEQMAAAQAEIQKRREARQ